MKNIFFFLFCWVLFDPISLLHAEPKAVAFDYGGVLANHNKKIFSQFLCNAFQITKDELNQLRAKKKELGVTTEKFWSDLAAERGTIFASQEEWNKKYSEAIVASFCVDTKMYDIVNAIKKMGIQVALFSNIEPQNSLNIIKYGLCNPFDLVFFSHEIGGKKPDPIVYRAFLEKIGLPAEEILFIDDTIENVVAANEMGFDGIVFLSKQELCKELEKRGLTLQIEEK